MTAPNSGMQESQAQESQTQENQTQEGQENSQQSTQTNLQGQPTNPFGQVPQTERHIDPLVQAAMRDLYLENKKLQEQIAEAKSAAPKEKATFDSFMADPEELISRAVNKQLAPFIQQFQTFGRASAYNDLKAKFKNAPQFAEAVQQYESVIDSYMQNAELTEQNFYGAIVAAAGNAALSGQPFVPRGQPNGGGVPNVTSGQPYVPGNVNQSQAQPTNQTVPGQARPSASPTPNPVKEPTLRDPTENERRIMRTFGYDPGNKEHLKEFYAEMTKDMLEMSPHPSVKKA